MGNSSIPHGHNICIGVLNTTLLLNHHYMSEWNLFLLYEALILQDYDSIIGVNMLTLAMALNITEALHVWMEFDWVPCLSTASNLKNYHSHSLNTFIYHYCYYSYHFHHCRCYQYHNSINIRIIVIITITVIITIVIITTIVICVTIVSLLYVLLQWNNVFELVLSMNH